MFAQLQAGMRGLQLVYNAVGKLPAGLAAMARAKCRSRAGWAADPDAFKAGLDLSVRALTDADRRARSPPGTNGRSATSRTP